MKNLFGSGLAMLTIAFPPLVRMVREQAERSPAPTRIYLARAGLVPAVSCNEEADMDEQKSTPRIMPLEKQYLTVGVVCMLIGTAMGFGIKAGVSMSALDTLKDSAQKRDEQYRHDQDMQHADMRSIIDDISTLKAVTKYQTEEIHDLKTQNELEQESRRR